MESIEILVRNLVAKEGDPTRRLQQINESILKNYKVSVGDYLKVIPKELAIFYVNTKASPPFVDTNMHCMLDPKTNEEIRLMQSGRFGRLYVHRKGLGGIDVCLSENDSYALCCTIRAAVVNGQEIWSAIQVRNAILDAIIDHEDMIPNLASRLEMRDCLNQRTAEAVLRLREDPQEGTVYHIFRHLRRRDRVSTLPLRSFMDLWNKKLVLRNTQKVGIYMDAHPGEDVLEVLRAHDFRYIPTEIKIRYNIDRRKKLYD